MPSQLQVLLSESKNRPSPRELEVLALVEQNYRNFEIAQILCITPETVRWHLRRVYRKLRTHDRHEAVSIALERYAAH